MKYGFTLAETLITLVIIGVVAAITIPSIMQSTQDAEFKTAYKKAFQAASTVTNQAIADNTFLAQTTAAESTGLNKDNFNTFKSYFKVIKDCSNSNNSDCWSASGEKINSIYPTNLEPAFIDNAGMAWSMYYWQENVIIVDINGNKSPNTYGKDRWIMYYTDQYNSRITTGIPSKIFPRPDVTSTGSIWCAYPPCYFRSWIFN